MREIHASLVILDISGYTRFITHREISLAHAEQIITQLVEAVIDCTEHPLQVNKLEGDAALLYSETPRDKPRAFSGVLAQLGSLFDAFDRERASIGQQRSHCPCDACTSIINLDLKAFVHAGDILIKQVRQFEELAGEPVIFAHRLMKNSVDKKRYVLVSETFTGLLDTAISGGMKHLESIDGFGDCQLTVLDPATLPRLPEKTGVVLKPVMEPERREHWNHFPYGKKPGLLAFSLGVLKMKLGMGKPAKK